MDSVMTRFREVLADVRRRQRRPPRARPSTTSPNAPACPSRWSPWCCRSSERVSDGAGAAVLAAIAELGYRPSRAATTLASAAAPAASRCVIDDYRNLWFVDLLARDPRRAERATASTCPSPTRSSTPTWTGSRRTAFLSRGVEGLIIADGARRRAARGVDVPTGRRRRRGTTSLGRRTWSPTTTSRAAGWPTDHLLELGHDRDRAPHRLRRRRRALAGRGYTRP